jgi:hypothetical protein
MRIDEFTSAEEQLALWKLVSDNVWQAISTQAEQERRANAEKAARAKVKRGKRGSKGLSIPRVPTPPSPTKPQPKAQPNATPVANKQQPMVGAKQASTQTQPLPLPVTATPPQQKTTPPTAFTPQVGGGKVQAQQQKTTLQPTPQLQRAPLSPLQSRNKTQKVGDLRRNIALQKKLG